MYRSLSPNFTFLASLILIIGVSVSGCSSSKRAARKAKTMIPKKDPTTLLVEQKLAANTWQPTWFRAKAKVKYKDPTQSQSFNAEIRLKKDEQIWVSITVPIVRIEVARALITPTSVQAIDRFNKQYFEAGIEELERLVNYPLDFQLLQNLVLGNPLTEFTNKTTVLPHSNGYKVQSLENNLQFITNVIAQSFIIDQVMVEDIQNSQTLNAQFEEYGTIDNKPFSNKRTIQLKTPQIYRTELKLSKVKMNEPQKMPFSINKSKYKPMRF